MDGPFDVKSPQVSYQVEKIIGISGVGNIRHYRVQWAPTWVSGYHLNGCEHLIQEFLEEQAINEQRKEQQNQSTNKQEEQNRRRSTSEGTSENLKSSNELFSKVKDVLPADGEGPNCGQLPCSEESSKEHNMEHNGQHIATHSDYGVLRGEYSEAHSDCVSYDEHASEKCLDQDDSHRLQNSSNTETAFLPYAVIKIEEDEEGEEAELPGDDGLNAGISIMVDTPLTSATQDSYNPLYSNENFQTSQPHNDTSTRLISNKTENSHTIKQIGQHHKDEMIDPHPSIDTKKPYTRIVRDKEFARSSSLKDHSHERRREKSYKCNVCEKVFSDNSNMRRHRRLHSGVRPFKCHVCGKTCSQKVHLENHMKMHTRTCEYTCHVCSDSFPTTKSLKIHLRLRGEDSGK